MNIEYIHQWKAILSFDKELSLRTIFEWIDKIFQ